MDNWLSRINPFRRKQTEGAWRPGPYWLPIEGSWLPAGAPLNFWQVGMDPSGGTGSAVVEACISAYSQTVAMCPGTHWRKEDDGGRTEVTTSSLSRVLKEPNAYQTPSDFLLNLVRQLYSTGNAYALAIRNSRFEIVELHLMNSRSCAVMVVPETGDIFYSLAGNVVIDAMIGTSTMVPARDVLHVRLHSSRDLLRGETPLVAALRDLAVSDAVLQQQLQFYLNQARPSMVLTTDMTLDVNQTNALRDRWNEQSRGLNAGGTPILTAGLKPVSLGNIAPGDAQLAELMKINDQNVALAFRVPLQILGLGGTQSIATEVLMQAWISTGLGFCLNHVEEAFDKLFDLWRFPDEYVEFDTSALLRSEFKNQIEALARAVQGGIMAPNEARAIMGYKKVKFGDEPRVQQQVVPLSAASAIPAAPASPGAPAASAVPLPKPPATKVEGDDARRRIERIESRTRRQLAAGLRREGGRDDMRLIGPGPG